MALQDSRTTAATVLCALVLASPLARASRAQDDDAAGERGRAELAALVQRALAEAPEAAPVELADKEKAFGLALVAVKANSVRVLAHTADEGKSVARALLAARALFGALTGSEAAYPGDCTGYLLTSPDEKAMFLGKHPRITPALRDQLAKLEGAGVPGTADWAFWEGDAEKRQDGLVRFAFDWLFRKGYGITLENAAWLHEGLGFYLTQALVGSRLTWFVPARTGDVEKDAANVALVDWMREPGSDWLALARELFAPEQKFDLEELFHLESAELDPRDHLRAHALAAYLVETHRAVLGALLQRVGGGEDARAVLADLLGFPLAELRTRLHAWLPRRDALVARAEGRRTEAELVELWRRLDGAQKHAAIELYKGRVAALDTPQLRALRHILSAPGGEVARPAELPFFDPKIHAPAQPIPRKRLSSGDARVKKLLKSLRVEPDPRAPVLAYDYDWGRGTVVRTGDPEDVESLFHNALAGFPPGGDLARAWVLRLLDRPDERKLEVAFAHAYSDREGNVYPVSLFDMWCTGETFEMPDVDTLGIVHDVLNEWKKWVAPVSQQDSLYKLIGELFRACRRSRELRATLADLWISAQPVVRKGYESQTFNLQALWATQDSDPIKLAALLPDGKQWETFLAQLVERCRGDAKLYAQGRRRWAGLRQDGEELRKALGAALEAAAAAPAPSEPSVPGR